eukprot:GGOE01061369.1.p1 GENE.GGOE01061369.1~~GGOE01061369.1.p1  ORF type:complete len:207 (+),score=63.01 GGOE01061369.1:58-621(+)
MADWARVGTVDATTLPGQSRGVITSSCVAGYTGHLPGCTQTVGVNWGMQKKISTGLLNSERAPPSTGKHVDKWGYTSFPLDTAFKNHVTGLYISALDPSGEAAERFNESVKHTAKLHSSIKLPAIRNPVLAQCAIPPPKKTEKVVPAKVVGWTGHRQNVHENVGRTINAEFYEAETNADYLPHSVVH